ERAREAGKVCWETGAGLAGVWQETEPPGESEQRPGDTEPALRVAGAVGLGMVSEPGMAPEPGMARVAAGWVEWELGRVAGVERGRDEGWVEMAAAPE
ncbi:MAG TPA: hypothetical protein VKB21_06870, partial [Candidatus Acidoferrum sp.]|nr:hypothetical protein [Candidatus Acidoferrum sp.]